jgi:hypothetical protein
MTSPKDEATYKNGLIDLLRNRQKHYQQSMMKLKDLDLKQHNMLGYLKNSLRQSVAVASSIM